MGLGLRHQIPFNDRFNLRDVEGGMNIVRSGQLEVNCGRVPQGAISVRKILRKEPDLLSLHVEWRWGARMFGLPLGLWWRGWNRPGSTHSCTDGTATSSSSNSDNQGRSWRETSQWCPETKELWAYSEQEGTPGCRMLSSHTLEGTLHGLVCHLRLAVRLWMISGGETHWGSQHAGEGSTHLGHEPGPPVRHYIPREAMEMEDMLDPGGPQSPLQRGMKPWKSHPPPRGWFYSLLTGKTSDNIYCEGWRGQLAAGGGGLPTGPQGTRRDESPGISGYGGPPGALVKET